MKKFLSLLLCLGLLAGLLTLPAGAEEVSADPAAPPTPGAGADVWDGTTKEPSKLVDRDGVKYFEITTAEELAYVAETGGEWLTYNYILANDLILNDVEIQVDDEGNCTNGDELRQWTPIGSSSTRFTGIFDGGDHIISGLYINTSSNYCGLFGRANKISNLTSVNACVKGGGYVGGIAGYSRGTITNCVNYGTVTGSGDDVGGITGYTYSNTNYSITNCVNYGAVTGSGGDVGGIMGYGDDPITNCVNYGAVTGSKNRVGGIAGYSDSSTTHCVNYGAVTGGRNQVGGIVGYCQNSSVTHCVNYGPVAGNGDYVGGIVGCSYSSITLCANYGTIIGNGNKVGGIVGYSNFSPITNCVNYGAVTGSGNYVGGIAGHSELSPITRCANYGGVSGKGNHAGGIAGHGPDSITNCANLATVSGADKVGGIVGENGDLTHCYSIAQATATGENGQVGGISGFSDHTFGKFTVTNCYYAQSDDLNETITAFGNHSGGIAADETNIAEAKTLAQLKQKATFVGWHFEPYKDGYDKDADWLLDPDLNGGYPLPNGLPGETGETVPVTGVSLKETALSLGVGDVSYLTVQFSPANATGVCSWASSDPAVAAVAANGRVEAKKAGSATVTVTCGNFSATCAVTVTGRTSNDYRLGSLVLRDGNGSAAAAIPAGNFWVSVPITKRVDAGNANILLAAYDSHGGFVQMFHADVSGLNNGQTVQVGFWVKNPGTIARVKAFAISSLGDLTPLSPAVEFGGAAQ